MKKISKYLGYAFLVCFGIFLFKIFVPKTYHVPQLQKRESTQYWDLTTGSRIGYTLISAKGEKKSSPIIYLHGGPSGSITHRNIETLSAFSENGYDIYLYDQVGCGQSNKLENIKDYSAERHKKDLEEIVQKIGAKKVILLGQSWGAMLATLFVSDNAEKIEKLIFTGPGPIPPVNKSVASLTAPDSLHLKDPVFTNADANELVQSLRNRAVTFFATEFGTKLASEKEADDFLTAQTDQTNKSMVCDTSKALGALAGSGFYAQVMTLHSLSKVVDPRPKLKNSPIPLLLMKGQCDNQKWGFITEYLELFPNHQLVIIPNAGHGLTIEQPELYLKTIRDFLGK
jgi:proline iminopeptidase